MGYMSFTGTKLSEIETIGRIIQTCIAVSRVYVYCLASHWIQGVKTVKVIVITKGRLKQL